MKKVTKCCLVFCVVCSCYFLMISCNSLTEPDRQSNSEIETVVVAAPQESELQESSEEVSTADQTGYCRGDELLCLPAMTPEIVRNANGRVLGGTYTNGTFKSTSRGGISFPLTINTSQELSIEFEIRDNIPNWRRGEDSGGKVSLVTLKESGGDYYLSLQRMDRYYRGGGVFRAILADRPNAEEEGAAFLITTSSLAGHYSMSNWGNEDHSFKVTLEGNACQLNIDSYRSRSASAPYSIRGRKTVTFILGNRELDMLGMRQGAQTTFIRVKITN